MTKTYDYYRETDAVIKQADEWEVEQQYRKELAESEEAKIIVVDEIKEKNVPYGKFRTSESALPF